MFPTPSSSESRSSTPPPRTSEDSAVGFLSDIASPTIADANVGPNASTSADKAKGKGNDKENIPNPSTSTSTAQWSTPLPISDIFYNSNVPTLVDPIPGDVFPTQPSSNTRSSSSIPFNPSHLNLTQDLAYVDDFSILNFDNDNDIGLDGECDGEGEGADASVDIGSVDGKVLPHPFLHESPILHFILIVPLPSAAATLDASSTSQSTSLRSSDTKPIKTSDTRTITSLSTDYATLIRSILSTEDAFEVVVGDLKGLTSIGSGSRARVGSGSQGGGEGEGWGQGEERITGTLRFAFAQDAEKALATHRPSQASPMRGEASIPFLHLSSRPIRSTYIPCISNTSSMSSASPTSPTTATRSSRSNTSASNASHRILQGVRAEADIGSVFRMIRPWGSMKSLVQVEVEIGSGGGLEGGESASAGMNKAWQVEFWRENEASRWERDWNGNDVDGYPISIRNLCDKDPVQAFATDMPTYASVYPMSTSYGLRSPFLAASSPAKINNHLSPGASLFLPNGRNIKYTPFMCLPTQMGFGTPYHGSFPSGTWQYASEMGMTTPSSPDLMNFSPPGSPSPGYRTGSTDYDLGQRDQYPMYNYADAIGSPGGPQPLLPPTWLPSPWSDPNSMLSPMFSPGSPCFSLSSDSFSTAPCTPPQFGCNEACAPVPWQSFTPPGLESQLNYGYGVTRTAASQVGLRARSFSDGALDMIRHGDVDPSSASKVSLKGNTLRPCVGQHVLVATKWNKKGRKTNSYMDVANLFISNLDTAITSDQLYDRFLPFGRIVSAVVMRDPHNDVSKGYGFVSYVTPEEASVAMLAMQNCMIGCMPVLIRWHEPRSIKVDRDAKAQGTLPSSVLSSSTSGQGSCTTSPSPTKQSSKGHRSPAMLSTTKTDLQYEDARGKTAASTVRLGVAPPSLTYKRKPQVPRTTGSLGHPAPKTVKELASLSASSIWQILKRDRDGSILQAFKIDEVEPDVEDYTKLWLHSKAPRASGPRRQAVATKLEAFLKPWGYNKSASKAVAELLEKEDPDSMLKLLNCYPAVAKELISNRIPK